MKKIEVKTDSENGIKEEESNSEVDEDTKILEQIKDIITKENPELLTKKGILNFFLCFKKF